MRSHMMNLPVPPKPSEFTPVQLSFEAESSPSQSSSSFYGLRENPKRSFRFTDPEFSFAADTGSVILQDRESETESSKNPTRRRSKRAWQLGETGRNMKPRESINRNESASSVSDTTTEEDVAFCLMMLSRDKWKGHKRDDTEQQQQRRRRRRGPYDEEEDDDEEEEEDGYESEELKPSSKKSSKTRGRYKCETCDKVFRSYQALGGHRASHKKIRLDEAELEVERVVVEKKIHECPVCFRVFASGQALGGHKRTHVIGSAATTTTATATATATVSVRTSARVGDSLIDLNLPAPVDDDDDVSQFDDSAVSDAEFVTL
ncbi:Zinc finger protein ZAT9 [Spatholobus suberectus]|nr:Zinc finger protein ZAT9 [Spatholobus suberectus]